MLTEVQADPHAHIRAEVLIPGPVQEVIIPVAEAAPVVVAHQENSKIIC